MASPISAFRRLTKQDLLFAALAGLVLAGISLLVVVYAGTLGVAVPRTSLSAGSSLDNPANVQLGTDVSALTGFTNVALTGGGLAQVKDPAGNASAFIVYNPAESSDIQGTVEAIIIQPWTAFTDPVPGYLGDTYDRFVERYRLTGETGGVPLPTGKIGAYREGRLYAKTHPCQEGMSGTMAIVAHELSAPVQQLLREFVVAGNPADCHHEIETNGEHLQDLKETLSRRSLIEKALGVGTAEAYGHTAHLGHRDGHDQPDPDKANNPSYPPQTSCPYASGPWTFHGSTGFINGRDHKGIDLSVAHGAELHAAFNDNSAQIASSDSGLGNHVTLTNGSRKWVYGHMSVLAPIQGASVKIGDVIGNEGNSGSRQGSSAPIQTHLHLETWTGSSYATPKPEGYLAECLYPAAAKANQEARDYQPQVKTEADHEIHGKPGNSSPAGYCRDRVVLCHTHGSWIASENWDDYRVASNSVAAGLRGQDSGKPVWQGNPSNNSNFLVFGPYLNVPGFESTVAAELEWRACVRLRAYDTRNNGDVRVEKSAYIDIAHTSGGQARIIGDPYPDFRISNDNYSEHCFTFNANTGGFKGLELRVKQAHSSTATAIRVSEVKFELRKKQLPSAIGNN